MEIGTVLCKTLLYLCLIGVDPIWIEFRFVKISLRKWKVGQFYRNTVVFVFNCGSSNLDRVKRSCVT